MADALPDDGQLTLTVEPLITVVIIELVKAGASCGARLEGTVRA